MTATPLAAWKGLCIDAVDPGRLTAFWAALLGRRIDATEGGDAVLQGATPAETIWVNGVPEPKTVKNRIHWDVTSSDLASLVGRGARVQAPPTAATPWHVCADPQGNEFCVFAP